MPSPRALFASAIVAALALACAASMGGAQIVRGAVRDQSDAPVAGAIVSLLSDGKQIRGTLSDDAGAFRLPAPGGGRYALRVMRIGFQSTTTGSFDLLDGQTLEQHVVAPYAVVRLNEVTVSADRRCVVRPEEGLQASALWEEAKKALYATTLTHAARLAPTRLLHYERDLDRQGTRVLRERKWEEHGQGEAPFSALPADTLSRHGYVRSDSSGTAYFAPDAKVLLSDSFLDDHCFRVTRDGGDDPGLIGLAFEPVRERALPDVRGALWLDATTAELRYIRYSYTRLPRVVPAERVGGRVEFRRTRSGVWAVSRWWIRMPIVAFAAASLETATVPGSAMPLARRPEVLAGIREHGGAIAESEERALGPSLGAMEGTVIDSTTGAPLRGARVYLSGTQYVAVSGAGGRFRMDSVPPATYAVFFTHPRTDSLAVAIEPSEVAVQRDGVVQAALFVPPVAALRSRACSGSRSGEGGVVAGRVRDAASGEPLDNAIVTGRWATAGASVRGGIAMSTIQTTSDARGVFYLCGVPANVEVRLRASAGRDHGEGGGVSMDGKAIVARDILVRRAGSGAP